MSAQFTPEEKHLWKEIRFGLPPEYLLTLDLPSALEDLKRSRASHVSELEKLDAQISEIELFASIRKSLQDAELARELTGRYAP